MKRYRKILYIAGLAVMAALPARGQDAAKEKKKTLQEQDYARWHNLWANGLSPDGRWASYSISYDFKGDTLFVRNPHDGRQYVFPRGGQGRFVGSGAYACTQKGSLVLTQLESGKQAIVPQVAAFQAVAGNTLLFAEHGEGASKRLAVIALDGTVLWSTEGVGEYALSDDGVAVAYTAASGDRHEVRTLQFGRSMKEGAPLAVSDRSLEGLDWSPGRTSLVFAAVRRDSMGVRTAERIYCADLASGHMASIGQGDSALPPGMRLAPIYTDYFRAADDGKRVFIGIERIARQPATETGIEVWNTLDRRVFSIEQISPSGDFISLAVWSPAEGTVQEAGNSTRRVAIMTGGQQHALVYDDMQYQPSVLKSAPRDIVLRELSTGKEEMLLERFTGSDECLAVSPAGKYVAYFLGGDWWLYSIAEKRHIRASRKEENSLEAPDNDFPTPALPAGEPAFTPGDRSFLYYDVNDIWEFSPDSGRRTRLTRGRESQSEFRFAKADGYMQFRFQKTATVDLDRPQGLAARKLDHTAGGYFLLEGRKARRLVWGEARFTRLMLSRDGKAFAFVSERYDSPKTMEIRRIADGKPIATVHRSNAQQDGFAWGRTEQVRYRDRNGKELLGVLHYPQAYDPGRKYPMVVHVYQKQAARLHAYINPLLHNQAGFNPTLLSAAGYFVLLPDVHLEAGNVGMSAVDGVTAAVEKVLETAPVDPARIGLMGASFGGYETCFIISKTKMFRAAVGGSSMTDFVSAYFSINGNERRTEDQRYETEQPRMASTPFENWEGYVVNSPLRHAPDMDAPLMLWTGSRDGQVDPSQSMALHLALRKLGKESVMVVYQGENHAMASATNQGDLTRRILQWFGWHLKGEPKPEWAGPRR